MFFFVKDYVRLAAFLTFLPLVLQAQRLKDLSTSTPVPAGDTIVIGFLGGYDRWDDPNRGVRKLVVKLRNQTNLHAESFGNHRSSSAVKFVIKALDTNRDGKISRVEAGQARIIIFGQSLGGIFIRR